MINMNNQIFNMYETFVNLIPAKEFKEIVNHDISMLLFNINKTEYEILLEHTSLLNHFSQDKFSTFELKKDLEEVDSDLMKKALYNFSTFQTIKNLDGSPEQKSVLVKGMKTILELISLYSLNINQSNSKGHKFLKQYIEDIEIWKDKQLINNNVIQNSLNDKDKEVKFLLEELLNEFNNLIGLSSLKKDIRELINLIKIRNLRMEQNLPVPSVSFHLVFTGNPGTGKTTVARLLAKIYNSLGVVSKGHFVEVDRSGLVAGYIGQTAIKVQEVVNKSLGGILFIDEAYSLTSEKHESDYGKEAIETLLKCMEDYRDDFVVIVAGYPNEMEGFLNSNPGLKSRFNKFIEFQDYDAENLLEILEKMCKDGSYMLTEEANKYAYSIFQLLISKKSKNFGNGRVVRNIFEKIISNQANRVIEIINPNVEELSLIEISDIEKVTVY